MIVDRSRTNKSNKFLQTSWTGIFGAVATLEAIVLAWWAEKIYQIWSRLYLFIATRWPWGVAAVAEEEAKDVQVAPKRSRRQPAIDDARDACYNLLMF